MPVDHPTFSESWYRVAELRPRLRASMQVRRQHFRGKIWHVVQDPSNNQFFRLDNSAYEFIGLLDGNRTVSEVWHTCNERLGDRAPTQGEAIQLLGQLYSSNLLRGDLPADAEGMFTRQRRRVAKEIRGYVSNLLFARIPLYDPDNLLNRWVNLAGQLFTTLGLILWLLVVGIGLYMVAERRSDLVASTSDILNPRNLPLLYLSFVLVKIIHEFGHAFACKQFGQKDGSGGEVHVMGIMLLVFTPVPYVDASSSWAFRNKWQRIIVAAAGVWVEFAVAAIAAMIWSHTAEGTTLHGLAFNMMFVASVSTLIFNGNPLLRYDAYYILSDLLGIPNLAQRGKEYLYYLTKRCVWGMKNAGNPAHSKSERSWLFGYAVASLIYRVFVCTAILLFISNRVPVLGVVMAAGAVVGWVLAPIARFVQYLTNDPELNRVRGRAVLTTAALAVSLILGLGIFPAPNRCRVEGVLEPVRLAAIRAGTDGFVENYLPSGQSVRADGKPLLETVNHQLVAQNDQLRAERRELLARQRLAQTVDIATSQIIDKKLETVDEKIAQYDKDIAALDIRAPLAGIWVCPDVEQLRGTFLHRGQEVGLVASLDKMIIRAAATQQVAAMITSDADRLVEMRLRGRPNAEFRGSVQRIVPSGQRRLPSPALGYTGGGDIPTVLDGDGNLQSSERFFEVQIVPNKGELPPAALSGQRVVVRFSMPSKPLAVQWYRMLRQLLQRRLHISG